MAPAVLLGLRLTGVFAWPLTVATPLELLLKTPTPRTPRSMRESCRSRAGFVEVVCALAVDPAAVSSRQRKALRAHNRRDAFNIKTKLPYRKLLSFQSTLAWTPAGARVPGSNGIPRWLYD